MNISDDLNDRINRYVLDKELKGKIIEGDAEAIRRIGIMGDKGLRAEELLNIINDHESEDALRIIKQKAEARIEQRKIYNELIGEKYIEAQLKYPEKDCYRLSKSYMKLCILHIINNEEYLCEDIFMKMLNTAKYEDTTTDMNDIQKLIDSIKKLDKKGFTYCVSSAFTLFENNLLKGLQTLYKNKELKEAKGNEDEKEEKNEIINEEKKPVSQAEEDDIL